MWWSFYRLIHVLGVSCFVVGFVLRHHTKLHSGVECEMTYSMRQFLEIPVNGTTETTRSRASSFYKLYKFVDQRDPLYQHFLSSLPPQPRQVYQHCHSQVVKDSSTTERQLHVVLYIPGHWGSYTQSRSLGAHGIQLTKQRENLAILQKIRHLGGSDQLHLDTFFVYEVYAVDFAEQGGALHGGFLQLQADFVANVIRQLIVECRVSRLTLVAHSMGGYVAQLAVGQPPQHPQQEPLPLLVSGIITLATPHDNPLYAFDPTIHQIYQQLQQQRLLGVSYHNRHQTKREYHDDDGLYVPLPPLISISGGLRDEMIDPHASEIKGAGRGASTTMSIQASHFQKITPQKDQQQHLSSLLSSSSSLGVDHRAIVWCHQLLTNVRSIVKILATATTTTTSTSIGGESSSARVMMEQIFQPFNDLGNVTDTYYSTSYREDTQMLYQRLQQQHGRWVATSMESSMLYNLPLLFAMYVVIASMNCATLTGGLVNEQRKHAHYNNCNRSTATTVISTVFPLIWVIGVVWKNNNVNNIQYFTSTIIWGLTANFFNDLLMGTVLMPRNVFLKRRTTKHQQQLHKGHRSYVDSNQTALETATTAKVPSKMIRNLVLAWIATVAGGIATATTWFNSDTAQLGMGILQCVFFTGAIGITYIILMCHLNLRYRTPDYNNSTIHDDDDPIVQRQLTTLTMVVLSPSIAGPVTLMGWEHAVRWSSWWTLISLVFPMVLIVWLCHYNLFCYWYSLTKTTIRQHEYTGFEHKAMKFTTSTSTTTTKPRRGLEQQQQGQKRTMQSILILAGILTASPWILTRGSGYMASPVVQFLTWIELVALLVGLVLIKGRAEIADLRDLTVVHSEYKSK
jgi:pimeloyl-ACP methyl ester carboxylesterase